MSVQSELERLKAAIDAAGAAIEGKGVSVPTELKIADLAALIESIEAGGGGAAVCFGSFTKSTDTVAAVTITHNLGVVPNFGIVMQNITGDALFTSSSMSGLVALTSILEPSGSKDIQSFTSGDGSNSGLTMLSLQTITKASQNNRMSFFGATETTIEVGGLYPFAIEGMVFAGGVEYVYIVGRFE